MLEKISFVTENDEKVELFVVEETKVNGMNYLLVTESQDEDAECYIFKDTSSAEDAESCYVEVEDSNEFDAVAKIFEELLDEEAEIIK